MADETTGRDASNDTNNPVKKNAVPGQPDTAFVHPEHPPVSNIMPHHEEKPAEPIVVPPKPPVTNIMPEAPVPHIDVAPMPAFDPAQLPKAAPVPDQPKPIDVLAGAPAKPAPPPAKEKDEIAESVGLVKPPPKAKEPLREDVASILKSVKLPEKRAYQPEGEKRRAAAAPAPEPEGKTLDAILSARITENTPQAAPINPPAPAPIEPSVVPQQDVFHEDMQIESVHTLKQDLQQVVREQKMSVVKAVALEQEKKARIERMEAPPKPPSRAPAVLLSIFVLTMLGLAALGGVYFVAVQQSTPTPVAQNTSIVFAEQTIAFPLAGDTPETIKLQLASLRQNSGTLGSLLHVVPVVPAVDSEGNATQRPATLSEFLRAIGARPPENLLRALGDDFFLGIHTVDKNAPILVIKVESYDRAFDGMLSWEKNLNGDFAPIFTPVPRLVMGPDGVQIARPYTDLVMRNYDVRAIKDDDGVIEMYYSFPTRDLLVIAESPYTFTEILSRLQAGRRL